MVRLFVFWVKSLFFVLTASFVSCFIYLFLRAFQNGGRVIMNINWYGEMYFESFIIVFYLFLLILRTFIFFKDKKRFEVLQNGYYVK